MSPLQFPQNKQFTDASNQLNLPIKLDFLKSDYSTTLWSRFKSNYIHIFRSRTVLFRDYCWNSSFFKFLTFIEFVNLKLDVHEWQIIYDELETLHVELLPRTCFLKNRPFTFYEETIVICLEVFIKEKYSTANKPNIQTQKT